MSDSSWNWAKRRWRDEAEIVIRPLYIQHLQYFLLFFFVYIIYGLEREFITKSNYCPFLPLELSVIGLILIFSRRLFGYRCCCLFARFALSYVLSCVFRFDFLIWFGKMCVCVHRRVNNMFYTRITDCRLSEWVSECVCSSIYGIFFSFTLYYLAIIHCSSNIGKLWRRYQVRWSLSLSLYLCRSLRHKERTIYSLRVCVWMVWLLLTYFNTVGGDQFPSINISDGIGFDQMIKLYVFYWCDWLRHISFQIRKISDD